MEKNEKSVLNLTNILDELEISPLKDRSINYSPKNNK